MPDPTPEQVRAVAEVLCGDGFDDRRAYCATHLYGGVAQIGACCREGRETAERILAAVRTDRAVQDAMLAALAEGGRLVEEEGLWPCPSRHYDRDHNGEWCDEACRSYEGHAGDHECVSGRHWPRTADDLPRKVHWIEPEWREVPNAD